jgi:hypothetical protein
MDNESFFGGVIYIDLRNYTKIVEEKVLENIANIIYDYQELVTKKINEIFEKSTISTIEYMGDGIMVVLNNSHASESRIVDSISSDSFCLEIYEASKTLKSSLSEFLQNKKEQYMGLEKLDFGIGISCSKIFQKYHKKDNRKIFFGTSLNRAAKIGDSMNEKYNNIAIDKKMYDEYLLDILDDLEKNKLKFREKPLVHMYRTQ